MKSKYKVSTIIHTLLSLPSLALSLITLLLLTCIINSTSNNKANAAVDANSTATIRVKSTCSMTATVDTTHTATLINGIYSGDYVDTTDNNNKPYENGIGQTTIQTFCNDPYGYAIYAIGYTGGDEGIANNRNTVLHSNTLANTYDIPTGTATSGDTSNWAMKLTSVDGTYEPTILNDYDDYHAVPANYEKVAEYGSGTDLTEAGSSLTTTYAAYISPTQPAGTYIGQVKYVLVHPNTDLGPDHNTMQDVEIWGPSIAIGQEVTTYDARDGKPYTVRRMCMNGDTTGNTWQEKEVSCAWEDSTLWMTQNLDLDLDSSFAFSSEDTDLTVIDDSLSGGAYIDGYTVDGDGVIYWTPTNSTIRSINTNIGSFNGWANNNNVAYSADPDAGNPDNPWYATGEAYNSDLCAINGNQTCNYLNTNNTVAPTYFSHTAFTDNGSHGKIGNYYNWSAAIASNNSSGYNSNTQGNVANNPQNSICPKGWRLPTVSSVAAKNEFTRLNNVYNGGNTNNGDKLVQSPLYLVRSGVVDGGGLYRAGYNGYYWSSTASGDSHAFYLQFRSDHVNPEYSFYIRGYGWVVRCVSDYK